MLSETIGLQVLKNPSSLSFCFSKCTGLEGLPCRVIILVSANVGSEPCIYQFQTPIRYLSYVYSDGCGKRKEGEEEEEDEGGGGGGQGQKRELMILQVVQTGGGEDRGRKMEGQIKVRCEAVVFYHSSSTQFLVD